MKGSVHAEASAHFAALCCRRPGALVVGTTTLLHPAGQQHTLRYFLFFIFSSNLLKLRNFFLHPFRPGVFVVVDSLSLEQVVDAYWFECMLVQDSVCSRVCV